MIYKVLIKKNLYIFFMYSAYSQDKQKNNFPEQEVNVNNLSPKNNLWVFILAGQSYLAGSGLVKPKDTIPNARILTINKNNKWILAKEPLHFYHPPLTGLDSGLTFAKKLINKLPDSVFATVLPCPVGGSSIQQWIVDSLQKGISLMSNVREKMNLKKIRSLKGIPWHQGERDLKPERRILYQTNLNLLFFVFRSNAKTEIYQLLWVNSLHINLCQN